MEVDSDALEVDGEVEGCGTGGVSWRKSARVGLGLEGEEEAAGVVG